MLRKIGDVLWWFHILFSRWAVRFDTQRRYTRRAKALDWASGVAFRAWYRLQVPSVRATFKMFIGDPDKLERLRPQDDDDLTPTKPD